MDSVFGSPNLNRKVWSVNGRKGIKQEFSFNNNLGYKSKASSSVFIWSSRGRGVQGESVNAQTNSGKTQLIQNRKPT